MHLARWWNQYSLLPWPDTLAIYIMGFLRASGKVSIVIIIIIISIAIIIIIVIIIIIGIIIIIIINVIIIIIIIIIIFITQRDNYSCVQEERQRLMRRNIVRYSLLSYCMCMRTVSFRVKKRFPDLQVLSARPGT